MNPTSELGLCYGGQGGRRFDSRDIKATLNQWLGCDTSSSADFDHRVSKAQSGRLDEVIKDTVGIPRSVTVEVESLGGESL